MSKPPNTRLQARHELADPPRFDAQIVSCTPEEYFKRPGFSASRAKTVITRSPAHAKSFVEKDPCVTLDRGAVIHRLTLGKGKAFKIAPPEITEWRTKEAKAFRDGTRAEGLIPVKAHEFAEWESASKKLVEQLAARDIALDGLSECVIEWYEETPHGPLLCKGMFDHLWIDRGRILDLKVTENAAPDAVERTAENLGYAIQWAAYTRALTALRPDLAGRVKFQFAFIEPDEPWALNLAEPDGMFRELGEQRWLRACETWAKCQAEQKWPAYGDGVNRLGAPQWALAKEMLA
jgi:hypothetical protein